MEKNNDMLDFVLDKYGDIIKKYVGTNIGTSFYNNIEDLFDTFENIEEKLCHNESIGGNNPDDNFHTTIYADYSLSNKNVITDCVKGTIKDGDKEYNILKFMTPFTMADTYDFIIFNNSQAKEILKILNKRRNKQNFSYDKKSPIIGLNFEDVKKNTIDFLLDDNFRSYCRDHYIKTKRGLIFSGKPGTGKSMTIKYLKEVALNNNISFHSFGSAKEFLDNADEYFNDTKKIFIFEDFDTILRERKDTGNAPNQVLGSILNVLDGVNEINNVISIFTTNEIGLFDSAFIRPGRIDKVYNYNLPTSEEQLEFFKAYIPEEKDYISEMITVLKDITSDVSFAILKGICDDINIYKFYNKNIDMKTISTIVNNKVSAAQKEKTIDNPKKYVL